MKDNAIKRVVLCADDFGLTEGACKSIIALAQLNAISATSCVVDGIYTARYARDLLLASSNVSLGLHFNLTEQPLPQVTNQLQAAALQSWLLRGFLFRNIDYKLIEIEVKRQLNAFEETFKRAPDFVDGHEHVHQFPIIREALLEELASRYGTAMAIRSTQPLTKRGTKAGIIAMLGGKTMRRLIRQRGFSTNMDFAGVYNFSNVVPFAQRMRSWVTTLADGGLIMAHPEFPMSEHLSVRAAEHHFLESVAWSQIRQDAQVCLVPFSNNNFQNMHGHLD